jgi:hypothetical protein
MKYAWLLIIGVILLIIGLCLSYRWQVKEGMADTASIMLAGVGSSNELYIADTGLANTVKWNPISGSLTQISGSLGQIVGVNASNQVFYGSLVGKVSQNSGSGGSDKSVSPGLVGGREVYAVSGNYTADTAATTCSSLGATLATHQQVKDAQVAGAGWCTWGWISDISGGSNQIAYPVQTGLSCASQSPGVLVRIQRATGSSYGATCYGVKPAQGQSNALAFNPSQWNQNGFIWTQIPGTAKQVSFDYPFLAALDATGKVQTIETVNATTPIFRASVSSQQTFKWVTTTMGTAYAIGTDNAVYYTPDIRNPRWTNMSESLSGKALIQVAFDGLDVVVLDSAYNIYYASNALSPKWKKLPGAAKQISIKNHMMYSVGTDDNVYFSPDPFDLWIKVSSGRKYVDVFYPMGTNVITERPAIVTTCPTIFRAGSGSGSGSGSTLSSWLFGETCLDPCPPGYTQNTSEGTCVGIVKDRKRSPAKVIPPPYYSCPSGYSVYLAASSVGCKSLASPVESQDGAAPTEIIRSAPKEVYQVQGYYLQSQATPVCHMYGAVPATKQQLTDAYTAGATWCGGGWVSDDSTKTYNPDANGICSGIGGRPSIQSSPINSDRVASVNCYGVKPISNIATNITTFSKNMIGASQKWNQVEQCPIAHTLQYKSASCISDCPSGSQPVDQRCVYRTSTKTFQITNDKNFTCPVGYDLPTFISCGTGNISCTDKQKCYQSCPTNYTRDGTKCIGASTPKTNVGAVAQEVFAVENAGTPANTCSQYAATVATLAQLVAAGSSGSVVCQWGSVADNANSYIIGTCPNLSGTQTGYLTYNTTTAKTVTYCYGVKPPPVSGTAAAPTGVLEFAKGTWYMGTQCRNGNANSYEGPYNNISIGGTCPTSGCGSYTSQASAEAACTADNYCSGISGSGTSWRKQFGTTQTSVSGTTSFIKRTTPTGCFSFCGSSQDIGNESYTGPIFSQYTDGTLINTYKTLIAAEAGCSSANSTCAYISQISATSWGTYTAGKEGASSQLPTYIRNLPQCKLPEVVERQTVDATFTPRCPAGYTEFNTVCYQDCGADLIQATETQCQKPSVERKVDEKKLSVKMPTETACDNKTEELIGGSCVSLCAKGEISTPTSCTPAPMMPSGKPIQSNCNTNEILINNVCVSKCPEGTYPDGELCVSKAKVVPYPSSLISPCTPTPYGSYKKWLCDSAEQMAQLLTDPSSIKSYVDVNDQVCMADDPTTGMYFCQSGAEAKSESGYIDTVKSNYYSSCDQLTKYYADLSESIDSINTILTNLQNGTTTLSNTRTTLNEMSTKLNCTTATGNILTICNQLKAASTGVGTNSTNIQTILTQTTAKMREVLTSQNTLSNSMGNLQCAGATLQKKEASGGNLGSGMVGSRTEEGSLDIRSKGSAMFGSRPEMGSFGSGSGSGSRRS